MMIYHTYMPQEKQNKGKCMSMAHQHIGFAQKKGKTNNHCNATASTGQHISS